MSWRTLFAWVGVCAAVVGLATAGAAAQTPWSSTITGTVFDGTGAAVPGAAVAISAPTLIGGAQTTVSNADGVYRFTMLPPGAYDIVARRDGFQPLRRIAVRLAGGASVVIDFTLEVAGISNELEVSGRSPMVDVKSAAVPVRLDAEMLHTLPTARAIDALINLAPGISADVSFGGSQRSNEILVDGVRTTEPLFQEPLLRANHNWLESVQVVALGAGAEYGGFSGAAAYATLRSGANRFSGLGEFWTTRPGWLAQNTRELSDALQTQFLSHELLEWRESSAQVGGPIRQDRLWFFTGLQYARHDDRPAGFTGPGSRDEKDLQFIVKPTMSVSPALRVEGFIDLGRRDVTGEYIGPDVPIESSNDLVHRQRSWNAHAMWTISSTTLAEIRHGGYTIRHGEEPHPPGTRLGPPSRFDYGTGLWSVNTDHFSDTRARVRTTSATLTHHAERLFGGSHELKLGIEHEATRARTEFRYTGGRIYGDVFGEPFDVSIWDGTVGSATTGRWVAFAHDAWAVTDRLTVTPGLRLERNRGSVPNKPDVFATNTVAPRLGVAWDVTSDHRTVLRAHYGRYYDTIFASRILSEDTSENKNPNIYAVAVGPNQFEEVSRTTEEHRFAIDENIRHSRVNQFVLGIERELMTDLSLQAQYIRRRFDNFMGLIDTTTIYQPVQRVDPGPDNRLNTADDGAALTLFNATNPNDAFSVYTNPAGAFNKYDAVQLVARKRHSRDWQLQASYTWSKNRGTVGNRWHVNAARNDLGKPGVFVNPNLYINAYGRAQFDPTHEAKVLGSYQLPWGGVLVSGVYRYTTGQAWGRVVQFTGLRQGGQRVRIEPRGTRRAPAINTLALRVEKSVDVRGGGRIGLFLDAFNLSNQAIPDSDMGDAIAEVSGARFGQPNHWLDPRTLRAGVRVTF
jgi:hypothetical protein